MSKNAKSAQFGEREFREAREAMDAREARDARDARDSRKDRHERSDKDRESSHRRRRQRSPSYDSSDYDSDDSYYRPDSRYRMDSRGSSPPPRRPTRRHTTAQPHSDGEERGYRRRSRSREYRRRDSDHFSERSRSREREKGSLVEDLLAAVGLLQSKHKDGRSNRSVGDDEARKKHTREALQAALTAAAMEAFRTRKDGKLTPQRIMQIAGAAIAAGGLDVLVDKAGGNAGSMRSIIESVVGGLATSKTMGGKVQQKREGGVADKLGSGVVGMAARHLARSMSQGPTRRKTSRY